MSIIVVANQKGGVGKTALAVNLSHGLMKALGSKVLLVDADEGQSASNHFGRREIGEPPFSIAACANKSIHSFVTKLSRDGGFDDVVVDCPAGTSDITLSALIIADLVIIPVRPSLCDYDAAERLVPELEKVAALRPDIQALVVISQKIAGTKYAREAYAKAQEFFVKDGLNVSVARQGITSRIEVAQAYAEGKTLFELRPGHSVIEFTSLTEEVARCLTA